MEQEDIKKIISVRQKLINFFNFLDGKHEGTSIIQQKLVAEELSMIIKEIDTLLKGKVEFK